MGFPLCMSSNHAETQILRHLFLDSLFFGAFLCEGVVKLSDGHSKVLSTRFGTIVTTEMHKRQVRIDGLTDIENNGMDLPTS